MCTGSLVPRPQITAFWLGTRLPCVYVGNMGVQSLPGPENVHNAIENTKGKMLLTTILCML